MTTPDIGVQLHAKGLSVALSPNEVELRVTRGSAGAMLTLSTCGISLRCGLPDEARLHLIALLSADPASPDAAGRDAPAGVSSAT